MTLQDQLEFIDITAPLKVDLIDSKGNAENVVNGDLEEGYKPLKPFYNFPLLAVKTALTEDRRDKILYLRIEDKRKKKRTAKPKIIHRRISQQRHLQG